jgi:hypothetical protein
VPTTKELEPYPRLNTNKQLVAPIIPHPDGIRGHVPATHSNVFDRRGTVRNANCDLRKKKARSIPSIRAHHKGSE